MLPEISHESPLWYYLSPSQKELSRVGSFLIDDRLRHPQGVLRDYSYLVFPYAKLYEGFLKQLLLDLSIITVRDYVSDHFRIGKVLSPHISGSLGERSAYNKIKQRYGINLADMLWKAWKEGRNIVFHYFPHNIHALTEEQALHLVENIISAMECAVDDTHVLRYRNADRQP